MPLRNRPLPQLQELCLKTLSKFVVSLAPADTSKWISNFNKCNDLRTKLSISDHLIKQLADYFSSNLPTVVYNALADEIITELASYLRTWEACATAELETNAQLRNEPEKRRWQLTCFFILKAIARLVAVALSPKLRAVNFLHYPKPICDVILAHLDRLSGLRQLSLYESNACGAACPGARRMTRAVGRMQHLVALVMPCVCKDVVIRAVSRHCPAIRHISVLHSAAVTNKSVKYLLKCGSLRELNVAKTSVQPKGLARVMVGLPLLRDIGEYGPLEALIDALENNATGPLALRRISIRNDIKRHYCAKIMRLFPLLEVVETDIDQTNLNVFFGFENMKEFRYKWLWHGKPFLTPFLEARGSNLTTISLVGQTMTAFSWRIVDVGTLVAIGRNCPLIRRLTVEADSIQEWWSGEPGFQVPPEVAPFQRLERLRLAGNGWNARFFEMMVRFAVNVRQVELIIPHLEHDWLERVLRLNPMERLEMLDVQEACFLKRNTLDLLMAKCPNLRVIYGVDTWKAFGVNELDAFLKFIVKHNYDLDVGITAC